MQHTLSHIQSVSISDLTPHPDNPRIHSKAQVKQIAKSIQTFGFKVPILVDRHMHIIAGHGRVMACQELGIQEVPILTADDLSKAQARALMLADNKLTENASWDEELLSKNFQILSDLDLDFELDITGFDYGEIEELILLDEKTTEAQEALPPLDESLPLVSKVGDIWQLGNHRILCANALDTESYSQLFNDKKADIVFSDPPYNLPATTIGKVCEAKHGNFQFASGEMSKEDFTHFLSQVFSHCAYNSKDGSIHYHCIDWRHVGEMLSAGLSHYDELKNMCVWVKDRAGMGTFYRSQHEIVMVFKKGVSPHHNHFKLGQHGRYRTNVWSYPAVRVVSDKGEENQDSLSIHPTVKPVAMIIDALKDCSKQKHIVLDPFLGSGSTLIACEKTNRHCYGIEIEPRYIDATIRRWQTFSGLDALCLTRGHKSWKELSHE